MVTGEECYRAMSELEQRRWMRNVIKHSDVPSNTLLGMRYYSYCDFIESSFDWAITKEGTQYWATVCNRYILHDKLDPKKRFNNKPPKTF